MHRHSWDLSLQGGKSIIWFIFGSFSVLKRNEDSPSTKSFGLCGFCLSVWILFSYMLIKLKQIEIFFDDVEKFLSQLLSCGHGIVVMLFIFYREIQFSPREGPQLVFFFFFL